MIAKFVGPKLNPKTLEMWIQKLNQELKCSNLPFYKNIGKRYFFLNSADQEVIRKVLMLLLFKTK